MRASSYFIVSGVAVALGLYEGVIVGSLPEYLVFIRPVLPFLVLCFILKRPTAAYLTAGVSGVIVDLLTATPAGYAAARWLIIALLIDLVQEHVIANRSLYGTLLLIVISRIIDIILLVLTYLVSNYLLGRLFIIEPWRLYLEIGFADVALATSGFLLISLLTKRFLTFIPFEKGRYGT